MNGYKQGNADETIDKLIKEKWLEYSYQDYLRKEKYSDLNYEGELSYAGRKLLTIQEGNEEIYCKLKKDEPIMIARFGENELRAIISGLFDKYPVYSPFKYHRRNCEFDGLFNGAGMFPRNVNLIPKFAEVMIDACKEVDLLGVWFNKYEDFVVEQFCGQTQVCRLRAIEPYYSMDNPWTRALKNKKVLVIHPFADSIQKQYKKREYLFSDIDFLPQMELMTMKAVQTIAGQKDNRFRNWFEALEYMHQETQKYDYDIAILGCGAYGFPLAARIKRDGKKAIHMGGATQILFGIKGKRWEHHEVISNLFNEYWIKPSEQETPKRRDRIEDNGCYW